VSQAVMAGEININTTETIEQLSFEIRNDVNEVLASKVVPITLINGDNIPLEVVATVPENNEQHYEPNVPIKFYFNKPVDLSLVEIDVKETFHGKTYSNERISGAQLEQVYTGGLVEIHRDQSPVVGNLSLVPGETIVEFYASVDRPYGAAINASIKYNGVELKRITYKVRAAPTFITGSVLNQLQQTLSGIEVSLPELGLTTKTNKDGVFSFGHGLSVKQNFVTGQYRLWVNKNKSNPTLAATEKLISVTNGQNNDGYSIIVPVLDPGLNYQNISSFTSQNVLSAGNLIIDTSETRLEFAGGEESGNVHVQMTQLSEGTYSSLLRSLNPLWMYQIQPMGIKVHGSTPIIINMPSLYGSNEYIPPNGTRVVLMGVDEETLKLTPVGAGRIENNQVISEGEVHLSRLDFIGYSFVAGGNEIHLENYSKGQLSLLALIGLLAQ